MAISLRNVSLPQASNPELSVKARDPNREHSLQRLAAPLRPSAQPGPPFFGVVTLAGPIDERHQTWQL